MGKVARIKLYLIWMVTSVVFVMAGIRFLPPFLTTLGNQITPSISQLGLHNEVPTLLFTNNTQHISNTSIESLRKTSQPGTLQESEDTKIILFWTKWFGRSRWIGMGSAADLRASNCPESRCVFTHDRSRLHEAAAVFFLSEEIKEEDFPRSREQWQRWVWVHMEAPPASNAATKKLQQGTHKHAKVRDLSALFNWTMSYHPASEVMKPYGAMLPLHNVTEWQQTISFANTSSIPVTTSYNSSTFVRPAFLNTTTTTYLAYLTALRNGKTLPHLLPLPWYHYIDRDIRLGGVSWDAFMSRPHLVAWMVSHCITQSRREHYVEELQHYVPVHIYGSCGPLRCSTPRKQQYDDKCWREMLGPEYLFYLAFENAFCDSYVTEKLWKPLIYGIVPVVLGGANYTNILPPHSYIDASTYTPRQLANVMLRLQNSPQEYAEYHLWRAFWKATKRPPLCELCLKLHTDLNKTTIQRDIKRWWHTIGKCRAAN